MRKALQICRSSRRQLSEPIQCRNYHKSQTCSNRTEQHQRRTASQALSARKGHEAFVSLTGLPSVAPEIVPSESLQRTIDELKELVTRSRRLCVVTGAGISTESGIPDYRSPQRPPSNPIMFQDFVKHPHVRQRYWARSCAAYTRFVTAVPNPTHYRLAQLEHRGKLSGLITQNVDGLHLHAGSLNVVEIHGTLSHVDCLACGTRFDRAVIQDKMEDDNEAWLQVARSNGGVQRTYSDERLRPEMKPDGDTELKLPTADFIAPTCPSCGSDLVKPVVVFFGENVPREWSQRALGMLEQADALLVVGSSLTVWSGYRFARLAAERGLPIGICNVGPTRADSLAAVKVHGLASHVLREVVNDI